MHCRLLDVVDERRSALVVAPTSSGKTFISYYIMKSILEEKSTDRPVNVQHMYPGCVLFVCPTKQLVNQVTLGFYFSLSAGVYLPRLSLYS